MHEQTAAESGSATAEPSGATWRTIPNLLSVLRIASSPLLLWLAWTDELNWFLGVLIASMATDMVDGPIARWLKQQTALGARLDSYAPWDDWHDRALAEGLSDELAALGRAATRPCASRRATWVRPARRRPRWWTCGATASSRSCTGRAGAPSTF